MIMIEAIDSGMTYIDCSVRLMELFDIGGWVRDLERRYRVSWLFFFWFHILLDDGEMRGCMTFGRWGGCGYADGREIMGHGTRLELGLVGLSSAWLKMSTVLVSTCLYSIGGILHHVIVSRVKILILKVGERGGEATNC